MAGLPRSGKRRIVDHRSLRPPSKYVKGEERTSTETEKKNMNGIEMDMWMQRTKAFAEGRMSEDPTELLDPKLRDEFRQLALEHLRRLEKNRVARVSAAQYRSGYSSDGELVGPSKTGSDPVERELLEVWPPQWA